MKPRLFPWLCAGLLAALLPLAAQQPPLSPKETTAARIQRLLRELDAPRFAVRERAMKELRGLEEQALTPLKKALTAAPSCEVQRRVETLLKRLAIYEPGGEVVSGLKLRLTPDRETVKTGETLKLTTTLANMTEKPIAVFLGSSTPGNAFSHGHALRRVAPAGPRGKDTAEFLPQVQHAGCGTGDYPLFATIPPTSVLRCEIAGTVIRKGGKTFLGLGQPVNVGGGKVEHFLLLETPAGEAHTLRVALEVRHRPEKIQLLERYLRSRNLPVPPVPPSGYWSGKVRSNDIRVTVAP
jgi:hypothetical protein